MKSKRLGRSGLELSSFGLLIGDPDAAHAPAGMANWCDVPVELNDQAWSRAARCIDSQSCRVLARVGPTGWDRSMLQHCSDLLARINRQSIDIWQLSMLDVERVKAGEPFRMMIKLKELGQVNYFGIRVNAIKDALWAVEHTPVHCVTLDMAYDAKAWSELLSAAEEAGTGIIGTLRTTGGDLSRAHELLANTSIAAFSWPARL